MECADRPELPSTAGPSTEPPEVGVERILSVLVDDETLAGGVRMVTPSRKEKVDAVLPLPVPGSASEHEEHILQLRVDAAFVGLDGTKFLGDPQFELEIGDVVGQANAVEVRIPPPLAAIFEILAPHLKREPAFCEIGPVEPHLSPLELPLGLFVARFVIHVGFVSKLAFDKQGDVPRECVKRLEFESRTQPRFVVVAIRVEPIVASVAPLELDFPANDQWPLEDVVRQLIVGPFLAGAAGQVLYPFHFALALALRKSGQRNEKRESDKEEETKPSFHWRPSAHRDWGGTREDSHSATRPAVRC